MYFYESPLVQCVNNINHIKNQDLIFYLDEVNNKLYTKKIHILTNYTKDSSKIT